MKLVLSVLLLFLCASCSQKNTNHNSMILFQKTDFINKPQAEFQQKFPNFKSEDPILIDGNSYIVSSLYEKSQQTVQVVSSPSTHLIVEVLQFPINEKTIDPTEYPNSYKPKCEPESNLIKYNTKSNQIALIKNGKIIFQGKSLLIQNRINDDKNKKCLNKWGH
jgi:hypothetical protein